MTAREKLIAGVVWTALCLGVGFLISDSLNKRTVVAPTQRIEHAYKDGTVEAARNPQAKPKLPAPKNPRKLPVAATIEVEVKPDTVNLPARRVGDVLCPAEPVECKPIKLRLDLIEEDGQQYVAEKAEDGTITNTIHIPFESYKLPLDKRLTIIAGNKSRIVTYTKDKGRWSYGIAGWEVNGDKGVGLVGSVSWR